MGLVSLFVQNTVVNLSGIIFMELKTFKMPDTPSLKQITDDAITTFYGFASNVHILRATLPYNSVDGLIIVLRFPMQTFTEQNIIT